MINGLFEVRELSTFVGAGRPADLAKSVKLSDAQWQAWLRLQKAALRFGGDFLTAMQRTNDGKDRFFVEALAFAQSFVRPVTVKATRKKKRRKS